MATPASGSQAKLGIIKETEYGKLPSNAVFTAIRHKMASFSIDKSTFTSEEKRTDRQTADVIFGTAKGNGKVEYELSTGSFSEEMSSLMGNNWIAGVNIDEVLIGGDLIFEATTRVIAIPATSAISLLDVGFKEYDIIIMNGVGSMNNDKRLTIKNVTTKTIEVHEDIEDEIISIFTLSVSGYKLTIGNIYKSFSMEKAYVDIAQYQLFTGCIVDSMSLDFNPEGFVNGTFEFIIQQGSTLQSTSHSTSNYIDSGTSGGLQSVNGKVYFDGKEIGLLSSFNMEIKNGLASVPIVGQKIPSQPVFGNRQDITGSMTALFVDETIYNYFANEQPADVLVVLYDANGVDFTTIKFPRIKNYKM